MSTELIDGSSELALQMDSYTNNTSLVLAIELEGGMSSSFPEMPKWETGSPGMKSTNQVRRQA